MEKVGDYGHYSNLEELKDKVYKCVKCGACRVALRQSLPSCPSGTKFGFDSYYALGRMELARSLVEGELEWSEKIATRFYRCTMCGTCDAHCSYALGVFRPLEILMTVRRELVKRGLGPLPGHRPVVDSMREYKNPFLQPAGKRGRLIKGKKVGPDKEVLFFVGCAFEFDPTSQFIAKATASILDKAKVKWGTLEDEEICCGAPVFDIGCEDAFAALAKENLAKINALNVKTIVTSCPGCSHIMKLQWTRYGELKPKVMHISEFASQLLREKRLSVTKEFKKKVTLHDPCWLGRYTGTFEEPREILRAIPGIELVEMERIRQEGYCCGAGGGAMIAFPEWAAENAASRLEEGLSVGAEAMVIPSCPECYLNFDIALHGYAGAVKLFQQVWEKTPVAMKFLGVAGKLASPFLKRRKKIDIELIDETQLLDQVTG